MTTQEIKREIENAGIRNQKVAMFHLQILKNADELRDVDPAAFCKEIGMSATFATEFRKMIALARLMKDAGLEIS